MRSFSSCMKLKKPLGPLLSGLSQGHGEPGLLGIHKDNGCGAPIILMELGTFQELTGNTPGAAKNCLAATLPQHRSASICPGAPSQKVVQIGLRVKAPGWAVQARVTETGRKPRAPLKGCATPQALFLLQEVHKTVSMRLNIVSAGLPGEF